MMHGSPIIWEWQFQPGDSSSKLKEAEAVPELTDCFLATNW